MFKFFKRSGVTEAKPKAAPPVTATVTPSAAPVAGEPVKTFKERRLVARPLPVPDVVEGDGGETDWALWEHLKSEETKHGKS